MGWGVSEAVGATLRDPLDLWIPWSAKADSRTIAGYRDIAATPASSDDASHLDHWGPHSRREFGRDYAVPFAETTDSSFSSNELGPRHSRRFCLPQCPLAIGAPALAVITMKTPNHCASPPLLGKTGMGIHLLQSNFIVSDSFGYNQCLEVMPTHIWRLFSFSLGVSHLFLIHAKVMGYLVPNCVFDCLLYVFRVRKNFFNWILENCDFVR